MYFVFRICPLIRLFSHLTKSFDYLAAIDDLSLEVEEGEIYGLVGPYGVGKTTTMRLLTSIMDPDGGEAWVAGRHVVHEAEAVKAEIGYMSQRFGLYADLTVIENIDFYADISQRAPQGPRRSLRNCWPSAISHRSSAALPAISLAE